MILTKMTLPEGLHAVTEEEAKRTFMNNVDGEPEETSLWLDGPGSQAEILAGQVFIDPNEVRFEDCREVKNVWVKVILPTLGASPDTNKKQEFLIGLHRGYMFHSNCDVEYGYDDDGNILLHCFYN